MRNRAINLSLAALLSLSTVACNDDAPLDGDADPTTDEAGIDEEGTGTDALDTDEGMVDEEGAADDT